MIDFRNVKISCPECGNNKEFIEIADDVILTTRYVQNKDGSFNQEVDESQILGEVQFLCGICGADLTQYHQRFQQMLF